ncbi:hypothetical protein ACPU6L_004841 [Klebsiella pneumoniae]
MTTDITELAQSEINDALAQLKQISEYPTPSTQYARVLRKYILALVEALEKAQQRIGKLEKKLTDHKRMNQEMAKSMLTPNDSDAAGMEIEALRQRIAELESRTVKLPHRNLGHPKLFLLCPFPYYDAEDMEKALAAAGIKVEAE